MKILSRFAIVLVVFSVLAAGCVPTVAPAASAPGEAVMTRALTSEPATIDPQGPPNSGLNLIMPYLFDTLVARDVDNTLVPALAQSWAVADDGLAITVVLKPDVVFHDGTPLNAEAVKFSFDRFKETGVASPVYEGINQITAIDVLDDLTVRFNFAAPAANFWSTISMPYAAIVSPASVEAAAGGGHLVGSGPFILSDWQAGQSITLVRNPDYAWGPATVANQGAPYLDKLIFKVIPDATTQLAALETGEVDVIFINQPSHYQQLSGNPDITLHNTVLNSLIYLGFNCRQAPFDETLVRQALSHAVNKDEIISLALGGLGEAATAPLPSTLPGYDPSLAGFALGLDLDAAAALLEQAGFERHGGAWERDGQVLKGRLLTSTRAPNEAIATLLQSQLAALGVAVEIQQLDSKAVMEATTQGDFELLLFRYDWNDPDALNIFLSTARIGSTNRVGYSNPDVDALLEQGAHELDETARAAIYVKAQELILQDAPWQPLYYPVDVIAIRNRIAGATPGYMGRLLVNDATVVAP